MSQNLSKDTKKIFEEILEDINFYFDRLEKTHSKEDELRFYFSVMKYYEILCKENNIPDNKILYQRAKENYDKLFLIGKVFSPNRKVWE